MRLIDADEIVCDIYDEMEGTMVVTADDIAKMPTVDAEPIRHGRWIRQDNGTWVCSECQSWIPDEQHYYARYCLHCGARMDEVTE